MEEPCDKPTCDVAGKPKGGEDCPPCVLAQLGRFTNKMCEETEEEEPEATAAALGGKSCAALFKEVKKGPDPQVIGDFMRKVDSIPSAHADEGWQGIMDIARERKVI